MLKAVTRRTALGACAGAMALGSARLSLAAPGAPTKAELFVFQAPATDHLVLAVISVSSGDRVCGSASDVRMHAGTHSWKIDRKRASQSSIMSDGTGVRVFAGMVHGASANGLTYDATVLETPQLAAAATREGLPVWAEIRTADGSRIRVGNPLVAELLAGDPALSRIYHAATPAEDRALFTNAIADLVARRTKVRMLGADAHAKRLADLLLPDVITYRSNLPAGFNFAGRNGRHPGDRTAAVQETLLNGAVAPGISSTAFVLTSAFPYFSRPVVL
ncbi:MAG TPA: hypothetical protein VGV37_00665 [Aliidongia sp.]|uniref:hypothetical protein n=1 Tax=Aliidongia sp. TaxID=1914230 RepID=UPI002DDD8D44|nr:hypothetical protein [Aliidongia sp.]HEV2673018.1 hypothetical protein [Aliidongia sp.]